MLIVLIAGCGVVDGISDKVDGLTNPLVAEGMLLGVQDPSSDAIDPSAAGFNPGASATVFLADANNPDDMENAPVSGARVDFQSDSSGTFAMAEREDGQYEVDTVTSSGFDYVANDPTTIAATIGDESHSITVQTPPPVDLQIPASHTMGQSLHLDASAADIDSLLVVVFRTDNGTITFSNQPTSVSEVYKLAHSSGEVVVDVPGDAFAEHTIYAVGAAGLRNGTESEFEEVNTVLSAIMAGELRFYPVSTLE